MDRIFAIINYIDDRKQYVLDVIKKLSESKCTDKIYVFTKDKDDDFNREANGIECLNAIFPNEVDNRSKAKNYAMQYVAASNKGVKWLNLLEDNILIVEDPKSVLESLERMLDLLDIKFWFGTACDKCNYIYNKYCPRISIDFIDSKYKEFGISDKLIFTSNANTAWTMFNLNALPIEEYFFAKDYNIPMFYILEYMARWRLNKAIGSILYMNLYPTIEKEHLMYKYIDNYKLDAQTYNSSNIKKENDIFKTKNISIYPDNNIDQVLENIYDILKKKLEKI